ncbi:MAG: AAA domain-containing protein [Bacteroidota bacterium]
MSELKSIQNQISFFVDCYQQENKNTRIEGIGEHNVEMFFTDFLGEDLKFFTYGYPMEKRYAIDARDILRIYRKEKEFKFYFLGIRNKKEMIPLFVYDAIIGYQDGSYTININFDSLFVNSCALENYTKGDLVKLKEIEDKLYDLGQWNEISKLLLLEIWTVFDEYKIPYNIISGEEVKENAIESILCYGIVKKSKQTRGIKEDLIAITKLKEQNVVKVYSDPVRALFTSNNRGFNKLSLNYKLLPYTLSYGQYRIFESIKNNSLSVLIGPPGTGKTFTLVSLALEAVRSGKSILICAKTDQALDVIEKKLKQEFENDDLILRVGLGSQVRKLKQVIADFKSKKNVRSVSIAQIKAQRKRAKAQFEIINKLEKSIVKQLEAEEDYGRIVYQSKRSILDRVDLFFLNFKISKNNKIARDINRLRTLYKARYKVNKSLVNLEHDYRVFKNYDVLKNNLTYFQKSLVARTSVAYDSHREKVDFRKLIEILPIWLVNLTDLNRSIPMKSEIFDFVFIDEASQCEVTLGIPALQRAKKAVVAGDPKQLNHVSFLPNTFIQFAKEQYNLERKPYYDYRKYSLLDMADAVTLHSNNQGILEEHYRSQPSIIGFNNDYFYGNRLKVMTAHGSHRNENSIHFIKIDGKQKEDNSNQEELEYIIDRIQKIYNKEKEKRTANSLGIIAPFRNQADAFKRKVLQQVDSDLLERHDLLIGTPFEFQGEERDIVFISLAVDNDSASGSFAYLSRENMLNVATSRAKSKQYVVHSFDHKRLSKGGLLERFFSFVHYEDKESIDVRDLFAKEVKASLMEAGVPSISQDEVISGISIDLLLHGEHNDLGVDLIGYRGAYDKFLNLEEIESLFRADKYVYVLPYRHWERNKSEEIRKILTMYNDLQVQVY